MHIHRRLVLMWAVLGLILIATIVVLGVASPADTGAPVLPTRMILPLQPSTEPAIASMPSATWPPTAVPSTTPVAQSAGVALRQAAQPSTEPSVAPLLASPPSQPVPGQLTIQFAPGTPPEQQAAYVRQLGATVEQRIEPIHTVVVTLPDAARALPPSPVVVAAEPDYYVVAQQAAPNDPLFSSQWALPAMSVPAAWPLLPPDTPPLVVAVIDSGICANHPDLAGRILPGYDFVQNDSTPQDEFGHGCGVSGVIAAIASNGIGIAGVAPNTRIMPLRVLDASGYGTYSGVAAAMIFAVDNGARIINLSLGGANPSSILENAVNYAVTHGVLVVAAAGNTGATANPGVIYPAAYPDVVAVASVDQNLQRSSFSSYGPEVDLLAPGRDIMTTRIDGGYSMMSGTSFAAPQVAGVAALELAHGRSLVQHGGVVGAVVPPPPPTPTLEPTEQVDKHGNPIVQLAEDQPIATDTWAVVLEPGSDPNVVAAQLNFENLGRIGTLEHTYLFRAPSTGSSLQAAQDAASALQAAAQVVRFEQQFAHQQYTRTPFDEPLYTDQGSNTQWHLKNDYDPPYTNLNLPLGWETGASTGNGIQIAIVDDGLQLNHPDLAPNYNPLGSCDYNDSLPSFTPNCNDFDPSPNLVGSCGVADCHGTAVAGVVAASDNPPPSLPNDYNFCGVGVAYGADLAGIRLIAAMNTHAQQASALTYEYHVNDIYSNSWGPKDDGATLAGPDLTVRSALLNGVTSGRGNLGNIYVWAAGNGRGNQDNVNADGYANSRFVIAVSAVTNSGSFADYSEPGAPILVTAPSSGGSASIATTDLMGDAGYNYGNNTDLRDCTNSFGGTSAATPMIAGVVALMLEANPNLGWRDVQHILVETARQNHPTDSDWTINGAGKHVNHNYGFGLVDAAAAVSAAQTWTNVAPEISAASPVITVNKPIPDNNPAGVTSSVVLEKNIFVEHVEVVFNAQHSFRGDIEVTLISPDGTQSRLMEERQHDGSNAGYRDWIFTSVRHWGEQSAGTWTLKVSDSHALDTGIFQNWQLIVYGTAAPPKPPVPQAPAEGVTITTAFPWNDTTLSWDTAATFDADHLELQIDTAPLTAASPVVIIPGTPASHRLNLPLGTHYWRLRALDEADNTVAWDDIPVRSFTITTSDNLAPPRNYFTTAAPVLTWNYLSWATGYQIEISTSPTFAPASRVLLTPDDTPLPPDELSFQVDPPLGEGVYYWRVRARRPNGTWSTVWSKSDSFIVDLPP